jgi:prolyl-tRNA synthetase
MKDSYSFDIDDEGLEQSYQRHRAAYIKTFSRLGLPHVIVSAMSGAMGGSASEEFLVPLEVGEDTFVRCPSCGYAANVEAVTIAAPPALPTDGLPPAVVHDTPDTPTIATLVDHLNGRPELARGDGAPWAAEHTLKNVVFTLRQPDGTIDYLAVGVPGDREIDAKRLEAALYPAEPAPLGDAGFEANPALVKGYIGPAALGEASPSGIRYLVDPRVVTGTSWVTGANEPGRHVVGLVAGRDFAPDGVIDVAEVGAGDPCPNCGGTLEQARGVEMGHIFQLGRKYAEALGLTVLGPDGKPITVTMGSYGIGVSRAVAAIAESSHDEFGLIWPREVAPADVHVVIAGKPGSEAWPAAEALVAELETAGVRVMLDDRDSVSPGVKFKDAELLGVPTIVVVGKSLADGVIEVKDRRSGDRANVPADEAVAFVVDVVGAG